MKFTEEKEIRPDSQTYAIEELKNHEAVFDGLALYIKAYDPKGRGQYDPKGRGQWVYCNPDRFSVRNGYATLCGQKVRITEIKYRVL